MKISKLIAYHQIDSRGIPTIGIKIWNSKNESVKILVPSGASTGKKEACELRDNNKKKFNGKSVFKAIDNINSIIAPKIIGLDCRLQKVIDGVLLKLDGTLNKTKLGANAILAVSLAVCKLAAASLNIPLYAYISEYLLKSQLRYHIPKLMINVINGGMHSNNSLDIQEFMIVPQTKNYSKNMQIACEVFYQLEKILKAENYSTAKGDEGGFAPQLKSTDHAFEILVQAINNSNFQLQKDVRFAIDAAASSFYKNRKYVLNKALAPDNLTADQATMNRDQLLNFYLDLTSKYPMECIEDPYDENDWKGFQLITKKIGNQQLIIGDDIYCTNIDLLNKGIKNKASNAILIKLNQIGTVSETIHTVQAAKAEHFKVIVSHRSGETEDTFIADFAVGIHADYIKTGSVNRSERNAKYNRLYEIEYNLKSKRNINL